MFYSDRTQGSLSVQRDCYEETREELGYRGVFLQQNPGSRYIKRLR